MSEENNVQQPTETVEAAKTETKKANPIAVREGALAPQDSAELGGTLTQIANGGGFPERFDTKEKRMAAYSMAQSLMGQQWQLALNHIAIIKGQMCIYGELPGTLAERTGEVEEKHTYLISRDYRKICTENENLNAEIYASVTKIKRKGRAAKEFTYSLDEAIAAGQYPAKKRDGSPSPDSPWNRFTKIMLMRKSQTLALKFEFPEAFGGVPIAEYDFDELPEMTDVTPKKDRASELNGRFKQKTVEVVDATHSNSSH